MYMIKISSVEEEKNIEKFLKKICLSKGYDIFTCEGISINKGGVELFERFETTNEYLEELIKEKNNMKDEFDFLKYLLHTVVENNLYDVNHYKFIIKILKILDINYNIIIHSANCSKFLWIKLNLFQETLLIEMLNNCEILSQKIYEITHKNEDKEFRKINNLKCIDKCLRKNNTPYPGNFDGMVYNQNSLKPFFIIEYSKVNWVYNIGRDIKYHLKWYCDKRKTKWKEDKNRWKSLKDLGNFLRIPVYIIWWGTQKEEYTIGKLEDVQENCYDSIKIIKEQINKKDLLNFFKQLMK